jgi:TetR/AcrR family transcriptional regulator
MKSSCAPLRRSVGRPPKSGGTDLDTRAEILFAARRVFARKGFDGACLREVAESAGLNKAMIYYHFRDKIDLYRAVLSDSFAAMQKIWEDDVFRRESTAGEKLRKYIEGFIRFQQKNADFHKILSMEFSVLGAKSENMKWIAKHYISGNLASLANILDSGMKSGEFKKTDPVMAVVVLLGMIIHTFTFMQIAPFVRQKKIALSSRELNGFITEIYFSGLSGAALSRRNDRRQRT